MTLDFAPMEGITGRDFREVHAACFTGVDRYWMPFLSPASSHQLTARQLRELNPGPLGCDRLVPQILTKDAESLPLYLWGPRIEQDERFPGGFLRPAGSFPGGAPRSAQLSRQVHDLCHGLRVGQKPVQGLF